MRRATSIDDYVADWRGTYVVARDFCTFHARPSLFGVVVWGRPDVVQARAIVASRAPEHVVLDYRMVEVIDSDAFRCLAEFVGAHRDRLAQLTAKVALVKPADP